MTEGIRKFVFDGVKWKQTFYNPSVMLRMTAPFAQGSHGAGVCVDGSFFLSDSHFVYIHSQNVRFEKEKTFLKKPEKNIYFFVGI